MGNLGGLGPYAGLQQVLYDNQQDTNVYKGLLSQGSLYNTAYGTTTAFTTVSTDNIVASYVYPNMPVTKATKLVEGSDVDWLNERVREYCVAL